MLNLELSKHDGADSTLGGDAEKKTEASFVRYATEDKEAQKSKQTKSFRLLKSSKNPVTLPTCSTNKQCACSNAVLSDDMIFFMLHIYKMTLPYIRV